MAAAQPNHRASLLAGLRTGGVRTGGVRSASVPHTASPGGAFNVPAIQHSSLAHSAPYYQHEEVNQLADLMACNIRLNNSRASATYPQQVPRTASYNTPNVAFARQQQELMMQAQMAAQLAAIPNTGDYAAQAHTQMQLMQLELVRLEAATRMQQLAQAQIQLSAQQSYPQRGSHVYDQYGMPPASAIPQGYGQMGGVADIAAPMTAGLGGRFGHRSRQDLSFEASNHSPNFNRNTSVAACNGQGNGLAPSKSDTAISWRRSSAVLGQKDLREFSAAGIKTRPEPLSLSPARRTIPALSVSSGEESESGYDSASSKSDTDQVSSPPSTPVSGNSCNSSSSAREEASKKLFHGLGMGRPSIQITAPTDSPPSSVSVPPTRSQRVASQPFRQPRGPPGAVDELGDKNFANRIRKRAIGGLGALLEAREKRESGSEAGDL